MTASGDMLICLVLDQSGSMDTVRQETIDGVNKFVEEQAVVPGDAFLTLTVFDTTPVVRYRAGQLQLIPPLAATGENSYQPSGGTALYDAVGMAITETERW